jgi:hypothetical protein
MQVRRGHVANSSSSSFVIDLEQRPLSVEHLHQMLFPDGEKVVVMDKYDDWTETSMSLCSDVYRYIDRSIGPLSPVEALAATGDGPPPPLHLPVEVHDSANAYSAIDRLFSGEPL